MADWSMLNEVVYSLRLDEAEFVVGGATAAALLFPQLNRYIGNCQQTYVYVSSTQFHEWKANSEKFLPTREGYLVYKKGGGRLRVYEGLPFSTIKVGKYNVMNLTALKHTLTLNGEESLALRLPEEYVDYVKLRKTFTEEELAYEDKCRTMDWTYMYSDQGSVYRAGEKRFDELKQVMVEKGGNYETIFWKHNIY